MPKVDAKSKKEIYINLLYTLPFAALFAYHRNLGINRADYEDEMMHRKSRGK